jgi:hypothetical protein
MIFFTRSQLSLSKRFLFFVITASALAFWGFSKSFDLRRFADTEIQNYSADFPGFSSIIQTVDSGNMSLNAGLQWSHFPEIFAAAFKTFIKPQKGLAEALEIHIKFKNLNKLLDDRKSAINLGILVNPKEVACKVVFNGDVYKCSVRLKGDLHDHWNVKTRMSLKIKLKDGFINGVNEFALQKPRARQFPYDNAFQALASSVGLLSSDGQDFYDVTVNNKNWGVMLFEETFSNKYLERRNVKVSSIYRISDQDKWAYARVAQDTSYPDYYLSHPSVTLSLKGNDTKLLSNKLIRSEYSLILNKLMSQSSDVFSSDKMLRSFLLALVWGETHSLYESNSWYYWNNYTQKLEPMLSDQGAWQKLDKNLVKKLILQMPFSYRVALCDMQHSSEKHLNHLSAIKKKLPVVISSINHTKASYFPYDKPFDYAPLTENLVLLESLSGYLVNTLNSFCSKPDDKTINVVPNKNQLSTIDSFVKIFQEYDGRIKIFNLTNLPIKITEISDQNEILDVNVLIPPSNESGLEFVELNTNFIGVKDNEISVISSYEHQSTKAFNNFTLTSSINTSKDCSMIGRLIESTCQIEKSQDIHESIVIKEKVKIKPGVTLSLMQGADILFMGGIEAIGEHTRPISILGDHSGGVLITTKGNQKSRIEHVVFRNLGRLQTDTHDFTGAVNLFGGNVELKNLSLSNNLAEDQINFVSTKIKADGIFIDGSKSDALDCDFCTGIIQNLNVLNAEGDGFDVSGSNLELTQFVASNVSDKAISIGEKSTIDIAYAKIEKTSTGIAVKDSSTAVARNIYMDQISHDAFMTYIKKPFYKGETLLKIEGFTFGQINNTCVRSQNTSLTVAGVQCNEQTVNVEAYYEGRMKK